MKRGDLVLVVLSNDYGKPRPALVIQSDLFDAHPSFTILPLTSDLEHAPQVRIRIEPTATNGLKLVSEVMVDKIQSLPLKRFGPVIGEMDSATMSAVVVALALFLGL